MLVWKITQKTAFNIGDSRDAKKESTREFRAYRGISKPRVNQEVVLIRDLEENGKILLYWVHSLNLRLFQKKEWNATVERIA